jgi:hypothetical protein
VTSILQGRQLLNKLRDERTRTLALSDRGTEGRSWGRTLLRSTHSHLRSPEFSLTTLSCAHKDAGCVVTAYACNTLRELVLPNPRAASRWCTRRCWLPRCTRAAT